MRTTDSFIDGLLPSLYSVYVAAIHYETQTVSICYVNRHIVMGASSGKIPYEISKYGLD